MDGLTKPREASCFLSSTGNTGKDSSQTQALTHPLLSFPTMLSLSPGSMLSPAHCPSHGLNSCTHTLQHMHSWYAGKEFQPSLSTRRLNWSLRHRLPFPRGFYGSFVDVDQGLLNESVAVRSDFALLTRPAGFSKQPEALAYLQIVQVSRSPKEVIWHR
jgi:hypothetical protein